MRDKKITEGRRRETKLWGLYSFSGRKPRTARKADTKEDDATLLRKHPIVWKDLATEK